MARPTPLNYLLITDALIQPLGIRVVAPPLSVIIGSPRRRPWSMLRVSAVKQPEDVRPSGGSEFGVGDSVTSIEEER